MFSDQLSDTVILREMGERLGTYRLRRNWTQAQLAAESGVSKRTIERLEAGESVQLANCIRVLRALDRLAALDNVLPPPLPSPMEQLQRQGKIRQRASSRGNKPRAADNAVAEPASPWQWGDQSEPTAAPQRKNVK